MPSALCLTVTAELLQGEMGSAGPRKGHIIKIMTIHKQRKTVSAAYLLLISADQCGLYPVYTATGVEPV